MKHEFKLVLIIKTQKQLSKVKAEGSENQSSQPLESPYLYQCSDQRDDPISTNPQAEYYLYKISDCVCLYKSSGWILRLALAPVTSCLVISCCPAISFVSTSLVLGLKAVIPRLPSPSCELCLFLWQTQSYVALGSLELTKNLSDSFSGIKGVRPHWLGSVTN